MKAKIFQPAKSATQSAKSDFWLLEFSSQDKPIIDDKMLWTSSSITQEVSIIFSIRNLFCFFCNSLEALIAF